MVSQAAGSVVHPVPLSCSAQRGYARAGGLASRRAPSPGDFGCLANEADGGTPLSAHMARASNFSGQTRRRQTARVVCDNRWPMRLGPRDCRRMAAYLEKHFGTVLAHVSIGTPVSGAFRLSFVLWKPLSEVGLDHFVKVLQALSRFSAEPLLWSQRAGRSMPLEALGGPVRGLFRAPARATAPKGQNDERALQGPLRS